MSTEAGQWCKLSDYGKQGNGIWKEWMRDLPTWSCPCRLLNPFSSSIRAHDLVVEGSESREKMKDRIKNSRKCSWTCFQMNFRQNRNLNAYTFASVRSWCDQDNSQVSYRILENPLCGGRQKGQDQLRHESLLQGPGSEHTGHPGSLCALAMNSRGGGKRGPLELESSVPYLHWLAATPALFCS